MLKFGGVLDVLITQKRKLAIIPITHGGDGWEFTKESRFCG